MANSELVYEAVGARIHELRKQRGMTQDQLASQVDLTRTSITNIEAGRQKILLHTLFELAAALGVEPLELLPSSLELVKARGQKGPDVSEKEREWIQSMLVEA